MRLIRRALLVLIVLLAAVWFLAPRPHMAAMPDPGTVEVGGDVEAFLNTETRRFDDIVEGTEARVVWAEGAGRRTPWAIVYVHGFSGSSEEIRPVPERIAAELGANLHYVRLSGHGRDAAAMGEASADDWGRDMAEALAVAERLGERVAVMSTSTGGTLSAIAAADLPGRIDAHVMISPNFAPQNPGAMVLTWPFSPLWVPLVAGETRSFEPEGPLHAEFWTEEYPTVATIAMQASVDRANAVDLSGVEAPALVFYSEADQVVDPAATRAAMGAWGGPVEFVRLAPGEGVDPSNHVLTGDILSPAYTERVIERVTDWLSEL